MTRLVLFFFAIMSVWVSFCFAENHEDISAKIDGIDNLIVELLEDIDEQDSAIRSRMRALSERIDEISFAQELLDKNSNELKSALLSASALDQRINDIDRNASDALNSARRAEQFADWAKWFLGALATLVTVFSVAIGVIYSGRVHSLGNETAATKAILERIEKSYFQRP